MNKITCIFLVLSLISCNNKNNSKKTEIIKLNFETIKNNYIVNISKNDTIYIQNDSLYNTSIKYKNYHYINLYFYISVPYLTNTYLLETDFLGRILVLESYTLGTSGENARIINVSLICIDEEYWGKTFFYNSFIQGAETIVEKNKNIEFSIYKLIDEKSEIYCKISFFINNNNILKLQDTCTTYCYENGLLNEIGYCKCDSDSVPFVNIQ